MIKAMKAEDLDRLLTVLSTQFNEYDFNQLTIALGTLMLYYSHKKYDKLPSKEYIQQMEGVTSSLIDCLLKSLSATILHNIPKEYVN